MELDSEELCRYEPEATDQQVLNNGLQGNPSEAPATSLTNSLGMTPVLVPAGVHEGPATEAREPPWRSQPLGKGTKLPPRGFVSSHAAGASALALGGQATPLLAVRYGAANNLWVSTPVLTG